ncbi:MAG: DUF4363 family protein [Clostridia bacterium]|nr:DUF4363 family protein [Clostridia bacterium]
MKKLVVISLLLLAVIGAGLYEAFFVSEYFGKLSNSLEELGLIVSDSAEDEILTPVITETDRLINDWEKQNARLYILCNNNVLNNVIDRMRQARSYLTCGKNADAYAYLVSASVYATSLAEEILPLPVNVI